MDFEDQMGDELEIGLPAFSTPDGFERFRAKARAFLRDREAAKEAFAGFLARKTLNASQIEFVSLIVDHLTEHGIVDPALLYESPFTDIAPRGPDDLFAAAQLNELLAVLDRVKSSALAA